jgi:geranylgeranyl diphosphate synthase type II
MSADFMGPERLGWHEIKQKKRADKAIVPIVGAGFLIFTGTPKYKHLRRMPAQQIDTLTARFEDYLRAHQPYGAPDNLYGPIRYINELGGKRIRPLLVLLAYNMWQEDIEPALPAALAVEYFHNFSLMHDDIMDEAPRRRGQESVHQKYGRNAAILSGDAMLIRCFELLLQSGEKNNTGAKLCSLMSKTALEICEGQQLDMDFEKRTSPTEDEYLDMIRKKTACLLGVSLQIGAVLAGASDQEANALYDFGIQMGMAFQIRDDYLDVYGDESLTGKQRGGDILRGKKNFLYVHTCNRLSAHDQMKFSADYVSASFAQKIDSILEWYDRTLSGRYADQKQREFFEKGVSCLDLFSEMKKSILVSFSQSLVKRNT